MQTNSMTTPAGLGRKSKLAEACLEHRKSYPLILQRKGLGLGSRLAAIPNRNSTTGLYNN